MKLTPPKIKGHQDWTVHRVGIYICDTNHKAMVGVLWQQELPKQQLFFEYVHGTIPKGMVEPDEILRTCRSQCVGTLVAGTDMWGQYLRQRKLSSARELILTQ